MPRVKPAKPRRAGDYAPRMARRCSVVVAILAAVLCFAGAAQADADPASDTLYVGDVFLPLSARVSPKLARRLFAVTRGARRAGKPIKVAVIASPRDLGGVPSIFGKPTYYARFLGGELTFLYTGKVLIVMPQGAGLSEGGRLIANPAVVHAVIGSGADGLARTAIELVQELALGKHATAQATPTHKTVVWPWVAVAIAVVVAAFTPAILFVRRRLRRELP
jgi:hypothetical protein